MCVIYNKSSMKKWTTRVLLLLFSVFCISAVSQSTVYAQNQSDQQELINFCGNPEDPYLDALSFSAPEGKYNVYAKLGKRGQNTQATLYHQDAEGGECKKLGAVAASGDKWKLIGVWNNNADSSYSRFQLTSQLFTDLPDANRPTIMLVNVNDPPCTPDTDCLVDVQGVMSKINPVGTLLNEDTLHVVKVVDPKNDALSKVDYYVDSKFVYTLPRLEEFDAKYVPGGKHKLTQVLVYKSGQRLLRTQSYEQSYVNDFQHSLFRLYHSNRTGLKLMTFITSAILVGMVGFLLIKYLYNRRLWKLSHGLEQTVPDHISMEIPAAHILVEKPRLFRVSKFALPFLIVIASSFVLVVVFNAYILQIFRVSGISMEDTLQNSDQVLVNKLGLSFSKLRNTEYTPKRGEVVIFGKAKSDYLKENGENEETFVIKRVMGLPGERIKLKDGIVTVFNRDNLQGFNPEANAEWSSKVKRSESESLDILLGIGEIFVIGDNRPESLDSRFNGPIQTSNVVGRASLRVWPLSKLTNL